MRLLICTQTVDIHDPILGFFHRWLVEFAGHFEHVDVICLREGTHQLPVNVSVYSLGKESGESRMKYLFRFYRFFSLAYMVNHVDFVFFHMGAVYNILSAPFFLVRKVRGTRFFWWKTHGHINCVGRLALCFVDRVYTASRESFPIPSKKRIIVGHAIDTEHFKYREHNLNATIRILFAGRIAPVKRVEHMVEIARMLTEGGVPFTMSIVGVSCDDGYLERLRKRVTELGMDAHVSFVGSKTQEELVSLYRDADILVNPSETGSIDKVVLEAMACGVLPIASSPAYHNLLSRFGLAVEHNTPSLYVAVIQQISTQKEHFAGLREELSRVVTNEHALATLPRRIFNT